MIKQSPILVTGCPRSGTSIIAAVMSQCGAFIGDITKRSMFENCQIYDKIVKPYFRKIKADPKEQYPLPDLNTISIPIDWRQKVEQVMLDQGYEEGIWMYKGTGMSLIWPVWDYAFPNAKWIIVRRKTSDIIQSCLKTGYMNAFSDEEIRNCVNVASEKDGWLWWIHRHEERFTEMITEGLNCKIVWPERMVDGDYQQLHEVLDWVGLRWKSEVLHYIDPLLWGANKKERSK